jgi:curved DNA-binding protein CbpA
MDSYKILDVPYNADQRTIKKAYAALIKQYRPDSHPLEFARIRSAYEELMKQCRYQQRNEDDNNASSSFEIEIPSYASIQVETQNDQVEQIKELVDKLIIQPQFSTENWQNDNNNDSFERLIDKPFIQLPEVIASDDLENQNDPYSRLVDKPIISQPLTLNQPIDKPEIAQTDTAPDVDELAWIEKPAIDIAELIEQLNCFKQPACEQVALACFQTQLLKFPAMNLDQRMDYEEKLYYSLIFNDRPPLLVFATANEYFDWTNNASWIKAAQSKWNSQRFYALSQLSFLYRSACQQYNPYFRAQHEVISKSSWLSTHYHYLKAQQQRDDWSRICQWANLKALENYFSDKPQHRPLYIIDFLLGAGLSYLVLAVVLIDQRLNYPFLDDYQAFIPPISAAVSIVGGFLSALLLSGVRAVLLFLRTLSANMNNGIKWLSCFVAITLIVSATMYKQLWTEDVGEFIFSVCSMSLLLIGWYWLLAFCYGYLIKLENLLARIMDLITHLPFFHKKPIA